MEHQKLQPVEPSQGTVLDPADAVEPIGVQEHHHPSLISYLSLKFDICSQMYLQGKQNQLSFNACMHSVERVFFYPKFMRRVCAGSPGGMVSRERKVQWTSLAW